jgi:AcrR family transcriptional regulator
LITTAAELFRRQGYAQTGVNQIIQEANATSGSFYHFFAAKEDLLLAVVDHLAEILELEIFEAAAEGSHDPIDEIVAILDLYRQQINDRGFSFSSPMAGLSAEVSESHPQVRSRLAEIFSSWCERIQDLLERAGTRMPVATDRAALAQLIVCSTEGAVLGTRLNHSLAPFDAVIGQLRSYISMLDDRTELAAAVPRPTHAQREASQAADWRSW